MAEDLNIAMIIKLLRMTESQHDGEALNAIRMANALLNKHNANWDELMRKQVQVIDADPFAAAPSPRRMKGESGPRHTDADEINSYFETLFSRNLGTFRDYVDSVHEWWEAKGFLTQKQYDVIKRSANSRRP